MRKTGGLRRKSRSKFTKHFRQRGKISLTRYFQKFEAGERVLLQVEPAVQKGMYDAKYIGKSGIIKQRTGKCYEVIIKDRTKEKTILVHPVHLKRG